ncbi:hypothetical protein [uncultured Chryseobacterium sp.]|uniref:bacteriocin-like protein n=1 Tax=uncultured Chryseobacterium sp. TaxID=259322 RepID=UPI0025F37AC9|nr:hypothetical protein [uncultured Chryseobacterium sp.]
MKNFKKLTRENLRSIKGGRACSIAIQGSDGRWTTRTGTCQPVGPVAGVGSSYCETGLGNIHLSSNDGVSHCND